jgi:hypothetical protein
LWIPVVVKESRHGAELNGCVKLEMVEGDQARPIRGDQMMCSKQLEKNLQIFERKILVRFQTLLLFANEYFGSLLAN